MNVPNDFEEFIALLNAHKVQYLVIGGYALALHGIPRYTGDIDVWIATDSANAMRIVRAVNEFGFKSLRLRQEDFVRPDMIHQFGYSPLRIDIVTDIEGVVFQDAWKRKIKGVLGKEKVWFISRDDLVKNKKLTGRPQDKLDLKNLLRWKKTDPRKKKTSPKRRPR